jgi:hypothetical protein
MPIESQPDQRLLSSVQYCAVFQLPIFITRPPRPGRTPDVGLDTPARVPRRYNLSLTLPDSRAYKGNL